MLIHYVWNSWNNLKLKKYREEKNSYIKILKGEISDINKIRHTINKIATLIEEDTLEETVYTQILMDTDHTLEEHLTA